MFHILHFEFLGIFIYFQFSILLFWGRIPVSPLQSFWYFGYLVCFCFTFYILSFLPGNTWYFVFHILHLSILRKDTWGPPSELLRHHPRFPIWGFPNILRFIHLTIFCVWMRFRKIRKLEKEKGFAKKNVRIRSYEKCDDKCERSWLLSRTGGSRTISQSRILTSWWEET